MLNKELTATLVGLGNRLSTGAIVFLLIHSYRHNKPLCVAMQGHDNQQALAWHFAQGRGTAMENPQVLLDHQASLGSVSETGTPACQRCLLGAVVERTQLSLGG